jgi:hypothetical protein
MSSEGLALFRMVIGESSRFPDLGAAVFAAGPAAAADSLSMYFREAIEGGRLKATDPNLLARQFLEIVKGDLHMRALMHPDDIAGEQEVKICVTTAVETFLTGCACP